MSSNIRILRVCQRCNSEFTARTSVTKYCGENCAKRAYKARKRGDKIVESNFETAHMLSASVVGLQAKEYLSITEACRLLGISRQTLWRLMSDGRLNAARLGKRVVLKRADIELLFQGVG